MAHGLQSSSRLADQLPSSQELNRGTIESASNLNAEDAAVGVSNAVGTLNEAGADASSVPPGLLYAGLGLAGAHANTSDIPAFYDLVHAVSAAAWLA